MALSAFAWADSLADDFANDYWVPRDKLSQAQASRLPPYCTGAYREPRYRYPLHLGRESFPVEAQADRIAYWVDERWELDGNVFISRGNTTIAAQRVTVDEVTQIAASDEQVTFHEPRIAAVGDAATINFGSDASRLDDAQFILFEPEMRGMAGSIEKQADGTLIALKSRLTRCEPDVNTWQISAGRFVIEDGANYATARNAVLRIKGVPVFYTPYIRIPVNDDRQSGFLFPSIGLSSKNGADVELPYYFNLAPNYDATVTPRYMSKRGTGIESQFRYLTRQTNTEIGAAFLPDDKQYNGKLSKRDFEANGIPGEFIPADRWLGRLGHRGAFGNVNTLVDFTGVSDADYFRDLGTGLALTSQVELERRGEIQYNNGGLFGRIWAQGFQLLENRVEPYRRIPELNVTYGSDLFGPFTWSLGTALTVFDRKDDPRLSGLETIVGDRLHVEPRLQLPLVRPWGSLTLTGGYRYTKYELEQVPDGIDDSPERGIGLASVDGRLIFERDAKSFGGAFTQTLEPRLYYLYQQYSDQDELPRFDASSLTFRFDQLYRSNRFSGLDRIGDANQLSVGLTTRFVNARTGRQALVASIGTIFYFEDRRVTLSGIPTERETEPTSEVVAAVGTSLWRRFNVGADVVYDPAIDKIDQIGASVRYRRDNRHILNLGYRRWVTRNINQADVSLYWPLAKKWGVVARYNYDLRLNRQIETFFGIHYENCCWQLRVLYRKNIEPVNQLLADPEVDKGIFVQFVLRGLAGFGTTIEVILERGIPGYYSEVLRGR